MITNIKTFAEKLSAVHPEKGMRRRKRKKTRMAVTKLFALNANAKHDSILMSSVKIG